MTKYIAAALVAATAFAGAAQAQAVAPIVIKQIESYAGPGADASDISYNKAQSLLTIINGGDSDGQKRQQVKHALEN